MTLPDNKLTLHGFNNLTKSFACSAYFIHYVAPSDKRSYQSYINQTFNASSLSITLTTICEVIGAQVLNIAKQNYQPHGSSATMLIAEGETITVNPQLSPTDLVAHLDKSHLCVHTYPEDNPINNIHVLRVDIDLASCGIISPLKALKFLLTHYHADIFSLDYRIRGFTRQQNGKKIFQDHSINSIQEFIPTAIQQAFTMSDNNMKDNNCFSTKLIRKEKTIENYIFGQKYNHLTAAEIKTISEQLNTEKTEIFSGI